MLLDFLDANFVEIWNTARLQAYLTNVGSPFDTGPEICSCDSLTPEVLGHSGPYTTPVADPAPWYDPDAPHSGQFLGFMPLSVDGVDDNPRVRSVTNAVGGGGVFGPVRDLPRTITVTGVLIGSTCCGADYGLKYLSQVLAACSGDACDGDCVRMYTCCPDPGMTPDQFNSAYRRTFRRTSLVSGPTVTRRRSTGDCASSQCAAGAELIEIEFVLVAANPWAWTEATPFLNVNFPVAGEGDCVDWCLSVSGVTCGDSGGGPCAFQDCTDSEACQDPLITVVQPPRPTLPQTSFCVPLVADTECYELDLTDRPRWSEDVPTIIVSSGSQELRNVQIRFYEKPDPAVACDASDNLFACEPVNNFVITYMPANSTLTIDGQIGRSIIDCGPGCQTASTVYGDDEGGPVIIEPMSCSLYCVCISADSENPVAPDATVEVELSGRGL